jgi:hypothetical protein
MIRVALARNGVKWLLLWFKSSTAHHYSNKISIISLRELPREIAKPPVESKRGVTLSRPLTACLAFLLLGCATTTSTSVPTVGHTLSDAEIRAILDGMHSAVKDLHSPNFRTLRAARGTDGRTYVCGWMNYQKDGYYTEEQPFSGTLSAGGFSLDRLARDDLSSAKVLSECRQLGVEL